MLQHHFVREQTGLYDTAGVEKPAEGTLPQPVGYLLNRFGLLIMLVLLIIAALNGWIVIVILIGLVLSVVAIARLWSRFSLVNLQCRRELSDKRVFPGEYIDLRIRVVNSKLLPLPWMQVDDEVPAPFFPDSRLVPGKRPGSGLLSSAAALLWFTGVSWRYRINCEKRGYYLFGPMSITSGDIFGLYPRTITEDSTDHIIVYPRIYPITRLDIPSLYPLGDTRTERIIFEDPTRIAGIREYTPHDSLRRIHWKASARHQNLQVKVFEPTTTLKVALFLAVDSFEDKDTQAEEEFELGVSTAASIARYITDKRSPAGVFVNSLQADSGQPVRIPLGGSKTQLMNILEALAKVTPVASASFEDFMTNERGQLPWGTTLILVISKSSESLNALLSNLRQSGHRMIVIQIGEREKGDVDGRIEWFNVKSPHDLAIISSGEGR